MPRALRRLELICFGPPTALLEGRAAPREVLWQKHLGLLIYLALSPKNRRTRSHLVGVFWPEISEQRARRALNEAVLRLRKCLGVERLRTEGDILRLADEDLQVDALRLAASATSSPETAAALLRGDFLEGLAVDAAPAFEEWARAEQERYRALAASLLIGIGERLLQTGRFTDSADTARLALRYAPCSEAAIRIVMRAAALGGDAGSAQVAYVGFTARLQTDLGERPSVGLAALAERIRRHHDRERVAAREPEPPLVGRRAQYTEAFQTVTRGLKGGPRTLVVTALPGMGRSRLVAEAVERATLDGALCVLARPLQTDQSAPWSALRLLLRGGLTDAPGLPGARPEALSAIASVVPELSDRVRPRPVSDVADMAAALASVIGTISEERPVLVTLDDAQWADDNSLAAVASAVRQLSTSRVALIVTAAQGVGTASVELLKLEADVGRGLAGIVVRLDPLTKGDLRALVAALAPWCREDEDGDRLIRRLEFETAGNPFFAVTLLKALVRATTFRADITQWPPPKGTFDESLPFSIPSLLRLAITLRVGELSNEEQVILKAASVSGQVLDPEIIAFVSERTPKDIEQALPAFERRAFVAFDGHRYVFSTPLVAEVVRTECLPRGERRRLEGRVAEARERRI